MSLHTTKQIGRGLQHFTTQHQIYYTDKHTNISLYTTDGLRSPAFHHTASYMLYRQEHKHFTIYYTTDGLRSPASYILHRQEHKHFTVVHQSQGKDRKSSALYINIYDTLFRKIKERRKKKENTQRPLPVQV